VKQFVLDTSICMRWLLPSAKISDQSFAEKVLVSLNQNTAIVPNLWHLEVSNVLLSAVRRADIDQDLAAAFMQKLKLLPISADANTCRYAFNDVHMLANKYHLSSYDAAYLALATRHNIPLATLDKDLAKACRKDGGELYQM